MASRQDLIDGALATINASSTLADIKTVADIIKTSDEANRVNEKLKSAAKCDAASFLNRWPLFLFL